MDSFFSLFDPSDSHSKPAKKRHKNEGDKTNLDTAKGRRRSRKSQGKNETLPEESSFLCEPDLSTEILMKDSSYIENYFEVKNEDNRQRRRNSGRKCRRKKNKISPAKDMMPCAGWTQDGANSKTINEETLNNQYVKPKRNEGTVGKNVNDLTATRGGGGGGGRGYNVIDNLERVGIKDDRYLAGDFEDFEAEVYSDDGFGFDSTSEGEDSGDECYGSLPPEPRFGNVEYKLQLVSPCERRFQHLVTQLKWRLRSGGGTAVYLVGVRDCGALRGLRARSLRASLRSLRRMADALAASVLSVRARRVATDRAVAEVCIRKLALYQSVELRVAVMGANEAGKSTLVGVLTQGELDNGRGSARLNMFRHLHEVKSGRTSSLSHEILGFDAQGNVINYGCSELMTAERIGERSAKLVSFLDLAGHSKYQRTTVHGLTGYSPHYAMLVVSATAGITGITEEHLGLLVALDMPFFVVISKCELATQVVMEQLMVRLGDLLATHRKSPLLITDENLARNCVLATQSILDTIDNDANDQKQDNESVFVFPVSCVRGAGLSALHAFLLALTPAHALAHGDARADPHADEPCEFQIDEIFHVGDSGGPVVGGLLARGQICEGDDLIIGPLDNGEFVEISVKTIYRNRVPCGVVRAGHSASLGLSHRPTPLRPGMVMLTPPTGYGSGGRPVWGCSDRCTGHQISELVQKHSENRKSARRKNKNILNEIAAAQSVLSKNINVDTVNRRDTSDSDTSGSAASLAAVAQSVLSKNINVDTVNRRDTSDSDTSESAASLAAAAQSVLSKNINVDTVNRRDTSDSDTSESAASLAAAAQSVLSKNINVDTVNRRDASDFDTSESAASLAADTPRVPLAVRAPAAGVTSACSDRVWLEDPNDPRGSIYFQAQVEVIRHSTAIYPGFQCSVHVGSVRQTAIIEGILSPQSVLRAGESASVVFRFVRCPEYLVSGRRLLFTAGLGTRGIGRITQTFPFIP